MLSLLIESDVIVKFGLFLSFYILLPRYSANRRFSNFISKTRIKRKVKRDSKKSGDLLLNLEESSVFKENCEPLDEIIKRLDAFSSEEIAESQIKIISILESISKSKRFSVSIGMV